MPKQLVTWIEASLLASGTLCSHSIQATEIGPLTTANLSPPIAIIGLPIWSDMPDVTTAGFATELANHYRLSSRVDDELILDGETWRLRAYFEKPMAKG